jgi:hypothetical protein
VDSTQGIDLPLAHEAIAQVQTWLEQARYEPVDRAARDLAGLLQDPRGLDFATGFVDQVVRPEDPRVAARAFRELSRRPPGFLSPQLRALVRLGGSVAPVRGSSSRARGARCARWCGTSSSTRRMRGSVRHWRGSERAARG